MGKERQRLWPAQVQLVVEHPSVVHVIVVQKN